ncbi:DUF4124 domain-containing protein [Schlegelella aquatica]|uniref:DUF4124 domain-containing protein n=1 Tax=Caldimonas aquatica TaxID=376175 RepID=UPI003750147D
MRALAIALVLATAASAAGAQVYQCPGPGGQKVFQQQPCVGGKELDVKPLPELGGTMLGGATAASLDIDRRIAIRLAAESGEPAVGMTAEQLQQVLGLPERVNVSNYGSGAMEQRIYRRGDRTYYVYTQGGQVTAIQNRDTGRVRPPCPSSLELRNAETSASSRWASETARSQYEALRRQAGDCR